MTPEHQTPPATSDRPAPGLDVSTGSDSVGQIFEDVARMNIPRPQPGDPYESEEYHKFVGSMVPHCHCHERNRPCDGVLAGGLCDNQTDDPHGEDDYEYRANPWGDDE